MKDPKKWLGVNGPLPGMNARNSQPKPVPQNPQPATPPPERKWQPGGLPIPPRPDSAGNAAASNAVQPDWLFGKTQEGGPVFDSVLPVHTDQHDDPMPIATQDGSPLGRLSLLGFAVVGGFVLIVSLGILQQPLSNLMQAQSYAKQQAMIEAQQRAEYNALDADVRGAVRQVQKNLVHLDIQAQDLAADAELRLGVPIQRLQTNPRERPRELDLAVLESKDMAANWASLTNAVCRPPQANPVYTTVQDLDNRVRDGKLIPADRDLAAGLLTLTTHQEEQAVKRYGHVRRLTESLEARRFELVLDTLERSN